MSEEPSMPVLVFSPVQFDDPTVRTTSISISESGRQRLVRLLGDVPSQFLLIDHVAQINQIAYLSVFDADLLLLASAIQKNGRAYVRFL